MSRFVLLADRRTLTCLLVTALSFGWIPPSGAQSLLAFCDRLDDVERARRAIVSGDLARAVSQLKALQAESDECQPLTLEWLGVAHERKGQVAEALGAWRTHLDDFPEHPRREVIQQRIADVLARTRPVAAGEAPLRELASRFSWYASLAQDYWASSSQWTDRNRARAGLVSVLDAGAQYAGNQFRMGAQVSAGYQHALTKGADPLGNDLLLNEASISLRPVGDRWGVKAGRQTSHRDGIAGRFSGVRGDVLLRDRYRLHATLGVPVQTPRYAADTDQPFVALSLDLPDWVPGLEASVFGHLARADGELDRKAVGGQLAWRRSALQLFAAVDYDVSFGVLNSATLHSTIVLSPRLQAWARARAYAWPRLQTSNALIGQNASSLDELLVQYTSGQLRTLAQNRTGNAREFRTGGRWTLTQRWSVLADAGYSELSGQVPSAGVAALESWKGIDASVALHGVGVGKSGSLLVASARWSSNTRSDLAGLSGEWRLPFGNRLRVAPRLALQQRLSGARDGDTLIITPGLRASATVTRASLIELSADYGWVSEDLNSLTGGELFSTSERTRELFFSARWELNF